MLGSHLAALMLGDQKACGQLWAAQSLITVPESAAKALAHKAELMNPQSFMLQPVRDKFDYFGN